MEDRNSSELLKGIWENLTNEQKEKAKACNTVDELTRFAAQEGIELTDELLETVSGGGSTLGYAVSLLDKVEKGTASKQESSSGGCG